MIKFLALFILAYSCAQLPQEKPGPAPEPKEEPDVVTVTTALDQSQMSYLRGCVEAHKLLKIPISFGLCRDRSVLHRQELQGIMDQVPIEHSEY